MLAATTKSRGGGFLWAKYPDITQMIYLSFPKIFFSYKLVSFVYDSWLNMLNMLNVD